MNKHYSIWDGALSLPIRACLGESIKFPVWRGLKHESCSVKSARSTVYVVFYIEAKDNSVMVSLLSYIRGRALASTFTHDFLYQSAHSVQYYTHARMRFRSFALKWLVTVNRRRNVSSEEEYFTLCYCISIACPVRLKWGNSWTFACKWVMEYQIKCLFFFLFWCIKIFQYVKKEWINIHWGAKVVPLKMKEVCNFHHRFTTAVRDTMSKEIQKFT